MESVRYVESVKAVEHAHCCRCCCRLQRLEILNHVRAASEPC
jgi:hypothetical protein